MVHTALLVIDMQKAFDRPIWGERNNPQAEHQALRVLAYFRKHALPVLHVQHISDNPQSQFHNKQNQEFKSGFEPVASEPVFQKTVNSAFIGTNLETYLQKKTDWSFSPCWLDSASLCIHHYTNGSKSWF